MMRSRDTLEKLCGHLPVGMRTPSWDYSQNTLKIAKEMGLLYDSSLMADDRPYEMLADGQPTGVVQLPVEWILDDAPYFWNDRSTGVRPTMNPDEVLAISKAEFDVAYEERTLFILTMHPHIIGHRARRDARPIDRAHEIQARRRLVRDARADRALREGAEVMETLRFYRQASATKAPPPASPSLVSPDPSVPDHLLLCFAPPSRVVVRNRVPRFDRAWNPTPDLPPSSLAV